jgi:hypothetical protein
MPSLRYLDALARALGVDRYALTPELQDAAEVTAEAPPNAERTRISLQDLGDEVHLHINERVPWDVALKVMTLLKASEAGS